MKHSYKFIAGQQQHRLDQQAYKTIWWKNTCKNV